MKLETTNKESRREWYNAAKRHLIAYFRGLAPGEESSLHWRGEEIRTMNDVYKHVLQVGQSAGKSLGGRMNPTPEQIDLIRELVPGIDETIRAMKNKPAALAIVELEETYKKEMAEKDQMIAELRKKVAWYEKQMATLIDTIGRMGGSNGD